MKALLKFAKKDITDVKQPTKKTASSKFTGSKKSKIIAGGIAATGLTALALSRKNKEKDK